MTENLTTTPFVQPSVGDAELHKIIIDAIQDKKGQGITIVNLSEIESAPANEFIICEGKNPQQVAAIADNVRDELLSKVRVKPYNYSGYRNSQWIVIDYGTTLVHVFLPETRTRYCLEELWSDATITEIPDLD